MPMAKGIRKCAYDDKKAEFRFWGDGKKIPFTLACTAEI